MKRYFQEEVTKRLWLSSLAHSCSIPLWSHQSPCCRDTQVAYVEAHRESMVVKAASAHRSELGRNIPRETWSSSVSVEENSIAPAEHRDSFSPG